VVAAKGRKKPSRGCGFGHICVRGVREGLKGPKISRVFEILFVRCIKRNSIFEHNVSVKKYRNNINDKLYMINISYLCSENIKV